MIYCPHCQTDRPDQRELLTTAELEMKNTRIMTFRCEVCSKHWEYCETMSGEDGINKKVFLTKGE